MKKVGKGYNVALVTYKTFKSPKNFPTQSFIQFCFKTQLTTHVLFLICGESCQHLTLRIWGPLLLIDAKFTTRVF